MDAEKIFSNKKSSNRGIADDQPVVEQAVVQPSVLEILDALGYFIDKRFNDLEAKLDKGCKCQKK